MPSTPTPKETAQRWLDQFSAALATSQVAQVVNQIHTDGWLRDALTFSWDFRTLHGQNEITEYLQANRDSLVRATFKLEETEHLKPEAGLIGPSPISAVSSGFTFETNIAVGQGYVHLVERDGELKAFVLYISLTDLKGHEEADYELGFYENHTKPWADVKAERQREVEENPDVVIIGGAQNGLQAAARFKKMGIRALVIEKNKRVGDNWRMRYPTLGLHTIKRQCELLYQPYPRTYPLHIPKDKLADWLEQYVVTQDLTVWTDSQILPTPSYDTQTRKWTVKINRTGKLIALQPKHIVVATSVIGAPNIPPPIPGQDTFLGTIFHSSKFQGGKDFTGKRVIVVGAGNTSADICQDLAFHKAASVTMVQRSTTCVVDVNVIRYILTHLWPDNVPVEVSDLKYFAVPTNLLIDLLAGEEAKTRFWGMHKEMTDSLTKAGLNLNRGPKEAGHFPSLVLGRFGGFWLDVGCAKFIASGDVKIKQGVEVQKFTKDGVVFTDGSSLEADTVIFATGYENVRQTMREIFGDESIDKTSPVWGLDKEGEVNGVYRPTGHPGLWFAGGDFTHGRAASKHLGILLKAIDLGLYKP